MSRIGKKPIDIPAGVKVTVQDGFTTVAGKLGTLNVPTQKFINVDSAYYLVTAGKGNALNLVSHFSISDKCYFHIC